MAEGAVIGRKRLKPPLRLLQSPGIDEERSRTQCCQILQHRADRTVSGDLVIGCDCGLGIALGELGRFAHAREMPVTGRAVGGNFGEGGLGLAAFAGLGERGGSLEGGAGLGSLLGLPPHVGAPSCNGRDQQDGGRDDIVAVAVPQLFELFSPNFLVDFAKDIGHEPPQPAFPRW